MSRQDRSVFENLKTSLSEMPRWKLALLLGTPVAALGLGCYMLRRGGEKRPPEEAKAPSKPDPLVAVVPPNTVDKKPQVEDLRSPLEKAVALKNKGNKLFKLGKFDAAIENYTKAIDECPAENAQELATFYQNRAAAYENLKDYEKIVADCSRALEYNAKYVKALTRRAKAYEQQKRLVDCLDDVSLACALEPNPNTFVTLERILKQLGKEKAEATFSAGRDPVLPSTHFIRTYFSAFSHDPVYNEAVARRRDAEAGNGDAGADADASPYRKAQALLARESYGDIIDLCDQELANESTPFRSQALLLRATFLVLQGCGARASKDLDALLGSDPAPNVDLLVTARVRRAGLWMQTNDTGAALDDFRKAMELDKDNSDAYHHRGQVHLMMNNFAEAVSDFDKCVVLCPSSPVTAVQSCYARYGKAVAEQDPGKIEKAMKDFYQIVDKFPECAEGWGLLGQVLLDQQQFENADKMFQKALSVEKDNASMLVHRGLCLLHWKNDIPNSCALIQKALDMDPLCEFAYEILGTLEVQRHNFDAALRLFDKAIQLAKFEMQLVHLYGLQLGAAAQSRIAKRFGGALPSNFQPGIF